MDDPYHQFPRGRRARKPVGAGGQQQGAECHDDDGQGGGQGRRVGGRQGLAGTLMMTSSSATTNAMIVPPIRGRRPANWLMIQARTGAASPTVLARLRAAGQGYVSFALRHSAHFRIVFGGGIKS